MVDVSQNHQTQQNAVFMFDMTIWHDQCPNRGVLVTWLQTWCKKYAFQLEKTSNGKLHWQLRVCLQARKRKNELLKVLPFEGCDVSPTSRAVHAGQNFNYVMKGDSRVEGPWTEDSDYIRFELTSDLEEFLKFKLFSWQISLRDKILAPPNSRQVIYIYDPVGSRGKSIFSKWLMYNGHAFMFPAMTDCQDMMQAAMCLPKQRCYIIDMPRALNKTKLHSFYAGIESLKNGYVYDKRNSFRWRMFSPPHVVIFSNSLPEVETLSHDRWVCYTIKNLRLVRKDIFKFVPKVEEVLTLDADEQYEDYCERCHAHTDFCVCDVHAFTE